MCNEIGAGKEFNHDHRDGHICAATAPNAWQTSNTSLVDGCALIILVDNHRGDSPRLLSKNRVRINTAAGVAVQDSDLPSQCARIVGKRGGPGRIAKNSLGNNWTGCWQRTSERL